MKRVILDPVPENPVTAVMGAGVSRERFIDSLLAGNRHNLLFGGVREKKRDLRFAR